MSQQNSTDSQTSNLRTEFQKIVPTVILAILTALGTSYCNSQKAQTDFQHRIEMLEKKAETNALNIAQNSNALQMNAIRIAEIGIIQNNTLEQIKDIKQEQNEIKLLLNKK